MKFLFIAACACLLCACSTSPVMQSSINGLGYSSAPTSANDARLRHPQFFRDENDSMPWLNAAPRNNQ